MEGGGGARGGGAKNTFLLFHCHRRLYSFCKQHRSRWDGSYEPSHLDLRCLTSIISALRINFFSSDSLLKKEKQTTNVVWNLAPKEITEKSPHENVSISLIRISRKNGISYQQAYSFANILWRHRNVIINIVARLQRCNEYEMPPLYSGLRTEFTLPVLSEVDTLHVLM